MLHGTKLAAARLVFLSACASGLAGVRQLPQEFIGLPAGFVQAGAACVIASLWPIGDIAALLLASQFYKFHLHPDGRERMAPAAALRAAQGWLRRLSFGQLRQMFPVREEPNGKVLLLQSGWRMTPVGVDQQAGSYANEHAVYLPLGPDGDCPYADPEHWAAFTATGW